MEEDNTNKAFLGRLLGCADQVLCSINEDGHTLVQGCVMTLCSTSFVAHSVVHVRWSVYSNLGVRFALHEPWLPCVDAEHLQETVAARAGVQGQPSCAWTATSVVLEVPWCWGDDDADILARYAEAFDALRGTANGPYMELLSLVHSCVDVRLRCEGPPSAFHRMRLKTAHSALTATAVQDGGQIFMDDHPAGPWPARYVLQWSGLTTERAQQLTEQVHGTLCAHTDRVYTQQVDNNEGSSGLDLGITACLFAFERCAGERWTIWSVMRCALDWLVQHVPAVDVSVRGVGVTDSGVHWLDSLQCASFTTTTEQWLMDTNHAPDAVELRAELETMGHSGTEQLRQSLVEIMMGRTSADGHSTDVQVRLGATQLEVLITLRDGPGPVTYREPEHLHAAWFMDQAARCAQWEAYDNQQRSEYHCVEFCPPKPLRCTDPPVRVADAWPALGSDAGTELVSAHSPLRRCLDGTGCLECGVCQHTLKARRAYTHCGHAFHVHCLEHWLRMRHATRTCPLCKGDLRYNAGVVVAGTPAAGGPVSKKRPRASRHQASHGAPKRMALLGLGDARGPRGTQTVDQCSAQSPATGRTVYPHHVDEDIGHGDHTARQPSALSVDT